jgi:uncharacterized alpha-E superfamily protein
MADDTNPRSLDFQLTHLVHMYRQLPRHVPEDLSAMQNALALLRGLDLGKLSYPLPGAPEVTSTADDLSQLAQFLTGLETLLPSWSNNLSSRYFSHARTLPVAIGL